MEMDMNLGGIMVKISRVDFFMVADNVHSYSYRLFPAIRKDSFRGQPIFWGGQDCLLYTSPSPRDLAVSRMPSSA